MPALVETQRLNYFGCVVPRARLGALTITARPTTCRLPRWRLSGSLRRNVPSLSRLTPLSTSQRCVLTPLLLFGGAPVRVRRLGSACRCSHDSSMRLLHLDRCSFCFGFILFVFFLFIHFFVGQDIELFSWNLTSTEMQQLSAATTPAGSPSWSCSA